MLGLFAEQLAAMCGAICYKIRAQFVELGRGLEAQAAAAEEDEEVEGELLRASVENVN